MYTEWTKHLQDPAGKKSFSNKILGAKEVLNRLHEIITEKENTLDRSEVSIETYNIPNWESRQAHKNGNRESLAWLKKLVDLDHQKGNEL